MRFRIKFVDFWRGYRPENIFLDVFEQLGAKVVNYRPEIIICSMFGQDRFSKKYKKCVKIYYTCENWFSVESMYKNDPRNFEKQIDFTMYDYAISHYWINDPRHFRLPNYIRAAGFEYYNRLLSKKVDEICLKNKSRFCCFVVSNPRCKERNEFFLKLSKYKPVDSYGTVFNNMGTGVNKIIGRQGDWRNEEYLKVISQYKFMIAFENSSTAEYTTEKITVPMTANTIPIYWGDPLVSRTFNSRSFINCHEYSSFDEVMAEVIKLDKDGDAYQRMLTENWLTNNNVPDGVTEESFNKFFKNILAQVRPRDSGARDGK